MIPLVIPPLTNLRILITRPVNQAQALCSQIQKLGGTALGLPVLEIKSREVVIPTQAYDLLIFVSANAVTHGLSLLKSQSELNDSTPHIAAIGNATATALKQAGYAADIIAAAPFNSEALLKHEAMQSPPENILLIRGAGGRDVLRDTLVERGSEVAVMDVYERVPALISDAARAEVLQALRDGLIDAITVTSLDIVSAMNTAFAGTELEQLRRITVIAGSVRIASQLPGCGWKGPCIVSASPDDAAMLKTLIHWHSRGRN